MPFLCRFSHKETCAPLILIPFSLVLKNAVSKTRTADNVYYFRATHSVSLQCGNPSGRCVAWNERCCHYDTLAVFNANPNNMQ